MYLNFTPKSLAPKNTNDCLLLLADGSRSTGWYSPSSKKWYAYDYIHERYLVEVSSEVVGWASLRPESGEQITCRHTRKNNSWFNKIVFNN